VLLLLLAIVLTPNGHWWTWAVYGTVIAIALLVSQITLSVLLKRVAVESAFVSVVLLGTLFREGGTVLWQWGFLKITTTGLTILGSVTTKSLLSLMLLNILTLTTSVPALLHALIALKTPPLLVAILESMYRYIAVLIDEFNSMRRAALSRNLMSSRRWQRLVVGNMIGSLFIRTYERGERVHQAMMSRGYRGLPPAREMPKSGRRDILALGLTVFLALVGQAIYLF
jgi:cobalt/nickel transport system permease protein